MGSKSAASIFLFPVITFMELEILEKNPFLAIALLSSSSDDS